MSTTCKPNHDLFADLLTIGLVAGLFASYIPQHLKIINKGSSEGFSPWFLLLGSTSSAAGMLNMWTMQWGVVQCCRYLSPGSCIESLGGVLQVSLQWALFTTILVLYMIYYPPHLKYADAEVDTPDLGEIRRIKTDIKTDHWRLSITLSWVVLIHMIFVTFTTFLLLFTTKPQPEGPDQNYQLTLWATFLGVSSAALAAIQYYPQLLHTFRLKLVGALSIPMMVIQSPGGVIMAVSIAMRPGTDWTSWIMFAVSALMQAILLVMCLLWKIRQKRLGIDDFGHPILPSQPDGPVLVEPNIGNNTPPMEQALQEAADEVVPGIYHPHSHDIPHPSIDERTPLIKGGRDDAQQAKMTGSRWFPLFRR